MEHSDSELSLKLPVYIEKELVGGPGLEPGTWRLSAACSTTELPAGDWCAVEDLNLGHDGNRPSVLPLN